MQAAASTRSTIKSLRKNCLMNFWEVLLKCTIMPHVVINCAIHPGDLFRFLSAAADTVGLQQDVKRGCQ